MKKSRMVIIGMAVVAAGVVVYWLMPIRNGINEVNKEVETAPVPVVNELPKLMVLRTNGETLALPEASDKSILIFFNPECDHCQREAKLISEQKNVFRNYTLYFISSDPVTKIEKFSSDYNLMDKNIIFAHADGYEVYRTVGPLPSVPAFFIYNNKKLVKRLEGEVRLEEIMKYL